MSDLVERLRERSCYASTNAEWPNRELQEAADRIEELEGIVRELIDANEDRAKKAVHHGKAHEIYAWIEALGRMKAAWDKARAALGE